MPVNTQVNQRFQGDLPRERRNPTVPVVQGRGVHANPLTSRVEYDGDGGASAMLGDFLAKIGGGSERIASAITHLGETEYAEAKKRAEAGDFEVDDNGLFRCVGAQKRAISSVQGANAATAEFSKLSELVTKRAAELRDSGKSEADQHRELSTFAFVQLKALKPPTQDKDYLEAFGTRMYMDVTRLIQQNGAENVARQLAREQDAAALAFEGDFDRVKQLPEDQRRAVLGFVFQQHHAQFSAVTGKADPSANPAFAKAINSMIQSGDRESLLAIKDIPLGTYKNKAGEDVPYTLSTRMMITDAKLEEADRHFASKLQKGVQKTAAAQHAAANAFNTPFLEVNKLVSGLRDAKDTSEYLGKQQEAEAAIRALREKVEDPNSGLALADQDKLLARLTLLDGWTARGGAPRGIRAEEYARVQTLLENNNTDEAMEFFRNNPDIEAPTEFHDLQRTAISGGQAKVKQKSDEELIINSLINRTERRYAPEGDGFNVAGANEKMLPYGELRTHALALLTDIRRKNPEADSAMLKGLLDGAWFSANNPFTNKPYTRRPGSEEENFSNSVRDTKHTEPVEEIVARAGVALKSREDGFFDRAAGLTAEERQLALDVAARKVPMSDLVGSHAETQFPNAYRTAFTGGLLLKEKAWCHVVNGDGTLTVKPMTSVGDPASVRTLPFDPQRYPELAQVTTEASLDKLMKQPPPGGSNATAVNPLATGKTLLQLSKYAAGSLPDYSNKQLTPQDHIYFINDGGKIHPRQVSAKTLHWGLPDAAQGGRHMLADTATYSQPIDPSLRFLTRDGEVIPARKLLNERGEVAKLIHAKPLNYMTPEERLEAYRVLPPRVRQEVEKKGGLEWLLQTI